MNYWPKNAELLTGDIRGPHESFMDIAVHLDVHFLALTEHLVPVLDALHHPRTKWLANDGVDDIADIATGPALDLAVVTQVIGSFLVLLGKVADCRTIQRLVLRHHDVTDVVILKD